MDITNRTLYNITGKTGCKRVKDSFESYEYCLCDFNQCNDMYPIYKEITTLSIITRGPTPSTTTAASNTALSVSIPLLIFTTVSFIVKF